MKSAPLPPNEAQRLEVLRRYRVPETPRDTGLEDIARVAAHLCGAPIALVSLVEEDRQYFCARVGLEMASTSREVSFCAHALLEPEDLLVVPDAAADERFAGNPLVTTDPKIRFYAGAPLVSPEGQALGTLCILDYVPRKLSDEQVLALKALSRGAMANMELRRAVERLADDVVGGESAAVVLERAKDDFQATIGQQRAEIERATAELRRVMDEERRVETELDRKQSELREAHDRALESDRLKSAFLANISHEIRTPLNVILGYNAMVVDYLRETGGAEYGEFVTGLEQASERLLATMERILDYAQISSGTLRIRREPLDLVGLLRSLVRDVRPLVQDKGLVLRVEIEPAELQVSADAPSLHKGLRNLLDNAIKFTRRGEVAVRLFVEPVTVATIEIRDTGVGIGREYSKRLFEPFSQEDPGSTRAFEGVGLGLALARRLFEMNGAEVALESEKGVGTVARVRFPD